MKGTLVLYYEGNRVIMERKYGRDCTFLNVKLRGVDDIRGMRFKDIKLEGDVSVAIVDYIKRNFLLMSED